MPFSQYEIINFENSIRPQNECEMLVQENLDDETYEYFRSRGMIHLLNDKIHIPKALRKHTSITITKFLTPDFSITQYIDEICRPISREYELKIDFGFMAQKNEDDGEVVNQYCWAQRSTYINPRSTFFLQFPTERNSAIF